MSFLIKTIKRISIFIIGIGAIWVITTQVFGRLDQRLPLFVALIIAYILSAYIILPWVIRISIMILRRNYVPKVTYTSDGLSADPVNIILTGTAEELISAFNTIGWTQPDRLTIQSSWKMAICFIMKKPYPKAPFSKLYLFGRAQDYGFQKSINGSPRERHHIRFWAANINPNTKISDVNYWTKKHPVDLSRSFIWVGAGTKDTGFSFKKLTYQLSHSIDKEIDQERNYIFNSLKQKGLIQNECYINAGDRIDGKYISDGRMMWAKLVPIPKS